MIVFMVRCVKETSLNAGNVSHVSLSPGFTLIHHDSHPTETMALSMVRSEATNLDPGKLFRICVELCGVRSFFNFQPVAQILFAYFALVVFVVYLLNLLKLAGT